MLRRLFVFPIACLVLAACGSLTEQSSGLLLTMAANRTVIDTANPAAITITVINAGAHTVQTPNPQNYACIPPFIVVDSAGAGVPLPSRTCDLVSYAPVDLAPGDSVVIHDQWAANKAGATAAESVPVAPGRYRIVANIPGAGAQLANSINVSVVNPLLIDQLSRGVRSTRR